MFSTITTTRNKINKCVSRLARRKSHHTALSNAVASNSECPPTLAAGVGRRYVELAGSGATATGGHHVCQFRLPDPEVMPPVTPREPMPMFTKKETTCPDSRPTRMQYFTPLAFSAAEKSVTVQNDKIKQTKKHTVN